MESLITIQNATKKYKNKVVFRNVNLNISKGSSYGFVGYNGCGKSVLFKAICGFSLLTEGEIRYQDKVIGKDIDFIENTGVIIETPEFLNDLSGYRNLVQIAEIKNIISPEEIEGILKKLSLWDDRNVKVGKYSLGMKQKLRIAQAIMEKPEILILDEPMNGLDKNSVELVRNILKEHVINGGTLLLTSHNKEDIDILCENIYEFDNGELIAIQNKEEHIA